MTRRNGTNADAGSGPAASDPRRNETTPGERSRVAPAPYAAPRLIVYGTVGRLTAAGGRKGRNDKAVKHSRTGF